MTGPTINPCALTAIKINLLQNVMDLACHINSIVRERRFLLIRGGESLIAKYSLPTPQASKSARTVKNQTLFFHGGVLPDLVKKYRYKFPYFFGTTSQIHALKYSQLNKGRMYSFSVVPDLVLEFNGLTNSAEYLALIYEIGESQYKAVRINGCIDFGRTSDFILVTDFTLVKNLIRV